MLHRIIYNLSKQDDSLPTREIDVALNMNVRNFLPALFHISVIYLQILYSNLQSLANDTVKLQANLRSKPPAF